MAENDGWVKFFRKLREHPAWPHDGMLKLLIHCVMEANYKPSHYLIPGTIAAHPVPRGSFITGREVLHKHLYPSTTTDTPTSRTVSRWLHGLEQMNVVKLQNVSNRCTLVTVVNYETYQSTEQAPCPTDVPPVSSTCPTDVRPVSTSEECKNVRKKETLSGARVFVKPSVAEVEAYCVERNNGITGEEFVTSYDACGWVIGKTRKPMKDWKAAVRYWEQLRNKDKAAQKPLRQRIPSYEEQQRRGWNSQTGLGE